MFTADMAAPAEDWRNVTPSDTVNLPVGCRSVYVGGAGNIVLVSRGGNTVTFTAIPAGSVLPVMPMRINATNTTATLIVALY